MLKRRGANCQDRSLRDAVFQTSQPASLAVIGSDSETSILDKLHVHADHVFIWKKSQQFAGEATVPDSVIGSCQVYKHSTGLLFCLETILDVLCCKTA